MDDLARLQPLFDAVIAAGGVPFVVGGFVRDTLLGIPSKDIDIEVHGLTTDEVVSTLKTLGQVIRFDAVGKAFGVLKITWAPFIGGTDIPSRTEAVDLDISLPRTEVKTGDGHQGFSIEIDPFLGIRKALARRDFTINAMAFDMMHAGKLVDPFDGWDDLKNGRLVAVGEAFSEDPLRVMRAVQFACRFGFEIEKQTAILCQKLEPELLGEISEERIWTEWEKIGTKGTHFDALQFAISVVGLQGAFGNIISRPMHLHGLTGDKRVSIALAGLGFNPDTVSAVPNNIRESIKELQDLMNWSTTVPFRIRQKVRTLKRMTWMDATRINPRIPIDPWVLEGPLPLPVNGDDLIKHVHGKPGKWVGDALAEIAIKVDTDPAFSRTAALWTAETIWRESLK